MCAARIRSTAPDFVVTERLDIEFTGDGEHDWLRIEKTGANTTWVAGQLARAASVHIRDVGYAGLKDRHAVTRQWFSVRRPSGSTTDWSAVTIDGVEILDIEHHRRKLKRGTHSGNTFRIALRGEDLVSVTHAFSERIQQITVGGVPNYFGEQRFGRNGSNVELGESVLAGKKMSRNKRSIGISALRSLHFNNELGERVKNDTWNKVLPGDTMNLDGTNSVFDVEDATDDLRERCERLDIHPTGILPAFQHIGVETSRRALRMRARGIEWELANDTIWLEFELGKGCFATAVLREIIRYAPESNGLRGSI